MAFIETHSEPERRGVELTFHLETSRPVDLVDLGLSFNALGRQFESYVRAREFEPNPRNARLFVKELRTGSILATLGSLLEQASFVFEHADAIAGFYTNLVDLLEYFSTQKEGPAPAKITREDAQQVSDLVEPAARDGGAQLNINITNNRASVHVPIVINQIHIPSQRANAIQNNARRFLGPSLPSSGHFEREVLTLEQMRSDVHSKAGDRGVIETFATKPVKLHFMTPEVKAAIIDDPENPFKKAYVVDGQVSRAKGKPALYKIHAVHDVLDRP